MNDSSSSFIKESIYQSQTRPINKYTQPPQVVVPIRQTRKQSIISNKPPTDINSIKIYEENLHLKNRVTEMVKEIKDLKEKLNKKDQNTRIVLEQQLKSLAQGKKADWDTIKAPLGKKTSSRGFSGNKGPSTNKIQHLLEIIDHYKQKLITSQEQIVNLRRQKQLLEQDVKLKDRKYQNLHQQRTQGNNIQQQYKLSDQLKRSMRQLQLQKERTKFLEMTVKSLQLKMQNQQLKMQQFNNLKSQNRGLQQKIIRLTSLPDFNNVIDKAQQQRKVKELQSKLKMINEKHNLLKDTNIKAQAELKLFQNKLVELTSDIHTLQKENMTLREQSVNDPIINKLMKQPQLLQKIIYQIDQQKSKEKDKKGLGYYDSKAQIQKLILQKEELGKHVLNQQSKLKSMEETFKERQRLFKIEKQETLTSLNQVVKGVSSKQGVIYDGDVDVFTQQAVNLPNGTNYFDLFLGQVSLLQSMVVSITGLTNSSSPLLLATVDFYNHNTEHSKLTQGCKCDLQSQFSFKVSEDDFFLKYLKKGTFQVDVWASQGGKNYHVGKTTIQLKHLVSRARAKISPVISTSVPLYLNQKVMGSISFTMRMRLPIFDQLQKLKEIGNSLDDNHQQTAVRRLVIQVDQGKGFGEKSNTFVYFPFRLQDFYTRTAKGNSPNWNYIKLLELNYDSDLKNYLKKNEIQFTVFDDTVLVVDEKNSDVVGSAFLSLVPLLQGKPIRERLEIRKGSQRKGTLDVKIYWHQLQSSQKDPQKIQEKRKISPEGIHEQIKSFMAEHSVDGEKIFRMIDSNKTGNVSCDEFEEWLKKISTRKYTRQTVNNYYKGFKQPVNLNSFVIRLSKLVAEDKSSQQPIVAGIGMINEFLKINSTQMKKKSIEDYLAGKNLIQVAKKIQTDSLGYISKAKLLQYLERQGVQAEITTERVKLLDFLRKKQSKMISSI